MGVSNEILTAQNNREPSFAEAVTSAGSAAPDVALWSCIGLIGMGGFFGVSLELFKLWQIWTTDPLRSIGAVLLLTSIVLILRVWHQNQWELRGTYWGLLPIILAFSPVLFSERLVLLWYTRNTNISFLPVSFPIYLYASGVVLFFAGARVWRRAMFPLALLIFLQPVPTAVLDLCDLPLQSISAHIARWFAQLIGLSPGNVELLRLMFGPHFGMFIAPGCDGMRGAITLAYGAMIVGYLTRIPVRKWIMYVAGSFMLGHVFNLLRLCALVVYYKVSLGHPWLENRAGQADYLIGGLLFLVAAFLFLRAMTRKIGEESATGGVNLPAELPVRSRGTLRRVAVLALLVLAAAIPGVRAFDGSLNSRISPGARRESAQSLNEHIPTQVGAFKLTRAWQEQMDGAPVLEMASFQNPSSDEIEIGIWLSPTDHSIQTSLMTHGESPKLQGVEAFTTAGNRTVQFSTALYADGITDTLVGDTSCSPSTCQTPYPRSPGIHLAFQRVSDHANQGKRWVPVFFKVQAQHARAPLDAIDRNLSGEVQSFLSGLNCSDLSQQFQ